MNTIRILVLCLLTTFGYAQKKLSKTSQSIKVNKDVIVHLNTSYVEIQLETWNRDVVEVEAYIESSKLTAEELEKALKAWNLNIDGSDGKVIISSEGGGITGWVGDEDYAVLLRDLEFELADMPELPEMPVMPEMPRLPRMAEMPMMPNMPAMPAMPIMPKLPALPKGVTMIDFDYEAYQKDGESYLSEWSKKYEEKGGKEFQERMADWGRKFGESGFQREMAKWGEAYGKRFEGKWAKDMEKWGEDFGKTYGKDMEKWGEEFGARFGKEWEGKMADWGERFGKEMGERSNLMEKNATEMEKRAIVLERKAKIMQERAKRTQKRAEAVEQRVESMEERKEERRERSQSLRHQRDRILERNFESGSTSKVRKVIKIKIPKKAKLKTNIRHGELKISSVIYNMSGDISQAFLVAEHIDGSDTSINVSYSPVLINTWNSGTLNLNFVDKAQIKNAGNLVLNSKSSNINIESLTDVGIIDGSFGDLTISNLSTTFKNLNLVLENSDALINLPKTDFMLNFKGNRSKYNNKVTAQKTIRNYPEGESSNRSISVNAKFSNVIIN
jgi:hypothetical protein